MYCPAILLTVFPAVVIGMIIDTRSKDDIHENDTLKSTSTSPYSVKDENPSNYVTDILQAHDAQDSANFFADIGPNPFSARTFDPPEYESLFDAFPNLPYFPDFGEIFRIQKSTTPKPTFRFPDYGRDSFSDRPKTHQKSEKARGESGSSLAGGRRPARRPPRPAPSGTKTKLAKQNQSEPKEKTKLSKTKPNTKAKDYPKIFRFTADRVNLADFDMRKKMNGNYETLAKGDDLDSSKIQRNNFLILHGGVFEIDRSMNNGIFAAASDVVSVTENVNSEVEFGSRLDKSNEDHLYKT